MPSSDSSDPSRPRRLLLAVVLVAICLVGTVPAVATPGGNGPVADATPGPEGDEGVVGTPQGPSTPSPETPGAGERLPGNDTLANATGNATDRVTPGSEMHDGPDEVRTAVNDSARRMAEAGDGEWNHTGEWNRTFEWNRTEEPALRLSEPREYHGRTYPGETGPSERAVVPSDGAPGSGSTESTMDRERAGGCLTCGGVAGMGAILVGIAGGAGAAASVGLSIPRPTVRPDPEALVHWLDRKRPRLPPVLPGRFGRHTDDDPLAHDRRTALLDIVEDQPGIHVGAVVDEMEISRSSVRHHVRVLESAEELETAKLLGRRRLFPPGADEAFLASLADEGSSRVVEAVAEVGPAPTGRIVEVTDKAHSTVSYHLDRLESAGVVERERDGRRVYVRLADEVADTLPGAETVAAD